MVIRCKRGKPRIRSRKVKGGTQRLTFCNNKLKEVVTFKKIRINKSSRAKAHNRTIKTVRKVR